ncbi:DNA translocase FtsK [Bacillus sp. JJ1474]
MSWIRKLFQMFKNDEHKNNDDQDFMSQDQLDRSDMNNQIEPSKDVNAKVLYQYPKGQFRFPLIPDEKHGPGKREPRLKREERPQAARNPEHRPNRNEPSLKEKKVHSVKEKREASPRKDPFRPTEIPSPIYGFERPITVEPIKRTKQSLNKYEPKNITYDDIKKKLANGRKSASEDLNSFVDSLMEDLTKQPEHAEPFIEKKQDSDMEELQEKEFLIADHFYREAEIEEAVALFAEEPAIEENEEQLAPEETEEQPVANETEEQPAAGETEEQPVAEETVEQLAADETEEQPAPDETEEPPVAAEKEEPPAPEEKEVQPSARKHIPFNVIMLKNDKQKLINQLKPYTAPKAEEVVLHAEKEIVSAIQEAAPAAEIEEELAYYQFPAKSLLLSPVHKEESSDWFIEQEELLNSTLKNFNVHAHVVNVTQGPSVTRFEVQPEPGVKVNKITNLSDDIKLSLAARDIRIEAPIPGKHTIGIEVPNKKSRPVFISEIINSPVFQDSSSPLTAVLGLDIAGNPIVTDLRKMPHGLIAGATGSGKSVCINTILVSLLYKATPDELKLILIDPKMVELAPYNRIPHLVSPVITDVKAATAALKWAVEEMERRYELFAHTGVRDISRFNELAEEHKRYSDKLPYMVIIIDELADLMMMSPADVEEAICRIAQKARACGIHLIIATQRPSVDVITGLIKANVPTRVAFSVSSQIDSRTIIDISGAEKLLGRGDMLFLENGSSKPIRLQGTYVSDQEIDDVVAHVRRERDPEYLFEQEELLKKAQITEEEDELFYEACEFVIDQGAASTSSLQRRFKVGYNRAARLIDMMEKQGFISETRGSKPREVLITAEELESLLDSSTIN